MRTEQSAVLASLRRAQQFLRMHGDMVTAVTSPTRKQLGDVITQVAELAVAQDTGALGSKGGNLAAAGVAPRAPSHLHGARHPGGFATNA